MLTSSSITTPTSLPFLFFFFNDTATTEIYTLSLHDALPISGARASRQAPEPVGRDPALPCRALRQIRRRQRGRATRDPALDVLGQPQAHQLHRHAALHGAPGEGRRASGARLPARAHEDLAGHTGFSFAE